MCHALVQKPNSRWATRTLKFLYCCRLCFYRNKYPDPSLLRIENYPPSGIGLAQFYPLSYLQFSRISVECAGNAALLKSGENGRTAQTDSLHGKYNVSTLCSVSQVILGCKTWARLFSGVS